MFQGVGEVPGEVVTNVLEQQRFCSSLKLVLVAVQWLAGADEASSLSKLFSLLTSLTAGSYTHTLSH